jgi:hypothetical protein
MHFLLTQAITHAPAIIEAERREGPEEEVAWRMRSRDGAFPERIIATIPGQLFRFVLARLNENYLEGQLYGGSIRTWLRQGSRDVVAVLHTANDGISGFWARIVTSSPREDIPGVTIKVVPRPSEPDIPRPRSREDVLRAYLRGIWKAVTRPSFD